MVATHKHTQGNVLSAKVSLIRKELLQARGTKNLFHLAKVSVIRRNLEIDAAISPRGIKKPFH